MVQDVVTTQIAGFYSDLITVLEDFRDFEEVLTFDRTAVFRYQPPTPVYHLKQKHVFALPKQVDLMLTQAYGDCNRVELSGDAEMQRNEGQIVITAATGGSTMYVPDNCALYVARIDKHCRVGYNTRQQLKFSSKLATLKGLYSNQILNLNKYDYLTSIQQGSELILQSYADGMAIFKTDVELVIPQNFRLLLYRNTRPMAFDSDRIKIVARPSNCPPFQQQRGFSVKERRDGKLEFHLDKAQATRNVYVKTPDGCELFVRKIYRYVGLPPSPLRKAIRYGFPRHEVLPTIKLGTDTLLGNFGWKNYVDTLGDLPALRFASYHRGKAKFQMTGLALHIVPAHALFHLHTVQEGTGLGRDRITIWIGRVPGCDLVPSREGLSMETLDDMFKIQIDRAELNRKYPIGSEFGVRSSCDLSFQRIVRTFDAILTKDKRTAFARIRLDSNQVDKNYVN